MTPAVPLFLAAGWTSAMVLLAWLAVPSTGPWFVAVLVAASALAVLGWLRKNDTWRGDVSASRDQMFRNVGLGILGMWCVAFVLAISTHVWAPPQLLGALLLLSLSLIAAGLAGRWAEKKN